jgi:DNA adenine methylase
MTYQGSKEKLASRIVPILEKLRKPGQLYWEPFLGSAAILSRMANPRMGTDNMTCLIMLWNEVINDTFIEPAYLTKEHYENLMKDPRPTAMRAYAGFFWSFSGMFNKGYSPEFFQNSRSFHKMRLRAKKMIGAFIRSSDYRLPGTRDALIYCDPPYKGTTTYNGIDVFDYDTFYEWCHMKQMAGNTVVISEYDMPEQWFIQVNEFPASVSLGVSKREKSKPEKLYVPKPGAMKFTTYTGPNFVQELLK